ncbi:hypothetical protein JHK87_050283 [Glycine soja]|nr:hypothetical protein JHK87_050283 [Glycine soja]
METIHETDYEYNPYAKEFGINIDSKLVSVEARYVELASEVCHRRGKIPVASEDALSAIPTREGITLSEQGCANRNSNPRGNFAERDLAR